MMMESEGFADAMAGDLKKKSKMPTLTKYLKEAKAYNSPHIRAVTIGNTGVDHDSVVGSIMLAWYANYHWAETSGEDVKFSPIINCPRNELKFRFDIVNNLQKEFGWDYEYLDSVVIYQEDVAGLSDP